jgi:hypothetical protein
VRAVVKPLELAAHGAPELIWRLRDEWRSAGFLPAPAWRINWIKLGKFAKMLTNIGQR